MGTVDTRVKPILTTIPLSQTEAFRAIGAGAKPLWSTDTIAVPTTNATFWAADVDSPTNVTYNLPLTGGGTQSLIVTPDELSSTGIYDRAELRYNKDVNQWKLVPIEKRSGVNEPFSLVEDTEWDWSLGRNKTITLTETTSITITNASEGMEGILEVIAGGHSLNINGVSIEATGTTTTVGIIRMPGKFKYFVDNNNIYSETDPTPLSFTSGDFPTSGDGYGALTNFAIVGVTNHSWVTQAGRADKIRFRLGSIPTGDATTLVVQVWRVVGSGPNFTLVGSQSIPFTSLVSGLNTHNISSPFNVQVGDLVGLSHVGTVSNTPFIVKLQPAASAYNTFAPVSSPYPWGTPSESGSPGYLAVINSYFPIQLLQA